MNSIISIETYPHIYELISGFLPPTDFLKCLRVCKTWKALIEDNAKPWQMIGWEVIWKREALQHEEHWEALKKALHCKDIRVVRKAAKILIWFDLHNYPDRDHFLLAFSPLRQCTNSTLEFPEMLDFILSISGHRIVFQYRLALGQSNILRQAVIMDQLESVKVIEKYKNKLEYQAYLFDHNKAFDDAFKKAAELNKIACLKYLLPHAFEKSIEEALTTSASYGHLDVVKFLTSELERRNLLNDSTLDKPLLVCIRYGKLECFQFLILKCQDVQNVVKNCVKKCVSCRFHFPTEESLRLALPATFIRHTEWLLQILNYAYKGEFHTETELDRLTGKREYPDPDDQEEMEEYEEMCREYESEYGVYL